MRTAADPTWKPFREGELPVLERQAELYRMALAEAGYPNARVTILPPWEYDDGRSGEASVQVCVQSSDPEEAVPYEVVMRLAAVVPGATQGQERGEGAAMNHQRRAHSVQVATKVSTTSHGLVLIQP